MKKILVYSDSSEYGGHEFMSVQLANALSVEHEVHFFFYNEKIGEQLADPIKRVHVPIKTRPGLFAFLRNFNIPEIVRLRSLIKTVNPDLSIILQPAVDICIKGALASKTLGIRTVSYIPMCFPARRLKGRIIGVLVDLLFSFYYRIFDAFITISRSQADYIKSVVADSRAVVVLDNVVDPSGLFPDGGAGKRDRADGLVIGVVGRIAFHQKRQDRLVDIAEQLRRRRQDFRIVIIGDGPDRTRLQEMIAVRQLDRFFEFKGWLDDKRGMYASIDLVLMVSEYEGVPIVMMEALYCRKMVMGLLTWGTQIYKEYLEPECLFTDSQGAVDKLAEAEKHMRAFALRADVIHAEIAQRHGPERFRKNALAVVDQLEGRTGA